MIFIWFILGAAAFAGLFCLTCRSGHHHTWTKWKLEAFQVSVFNGPYRDCTKQVRTCESCGFTETENV